MADGETAKEMAAGSSIAMWERNGTEPRLLDDMKVRRPRVSESLVYRGLQVSMQVVIQ